MQNLPSEIITQIYSYLHQQDQAQGRLVRSNFNTAISATNYQTVYLYLSRVLSCLVRNIIEVSTIANRIRHLIITFPEDDALPGDDMDVDNNSPQTRSRLVSHSGRVFRFFCVEFIKFVYYYSLFLQPRTVYWEITVHTQSLRLSNLDFRERVQPPRNFQVAQLVTHFSANVIRDALNVLRYVTMKYTGLISLEYEIGGTMIRNDQVASLFENGWVPFLTIIGAGLERLTSGAHVRDPRFVQAMDMAECQINYLSLNRVEQNLLQNLTLSRQAIFLETLVLKEAGCQGFLWLPFFINLRKLKLVDCRHSAFIEEIQLSHVLANAPETLESLSFENITIVTGGVDIVSPNITSPSFDHIWINQQMSEHIPLCFPSLSRLKVEFSPVERGYIDLSDFNLAKFHFVGNITFHRNSKNVQVYTILPGKTRFYYVDNYQTKVVSKDVTSLIDPCYEIPVRSVHLTMEEVISQVYDTEFILFCNSLGKLIFV